MTEAGEFFRRAIPGNRGAGIMFVFHFQSVPPKKGARLKVRARDARAAITYVEQHCPGTWDCRAQTDERETTLLAFFKRQPQNGAAAA